MKKGSKWRWIGTISITWQETNHWDVISLPRSVNLWKEDEDKPRKNARWKWHWRRGDEIKDEHEAREIQKL